MWARPDFQHGVDVPRLGHQYLLRGLGRLFVLTHLTQGLGQLHARDRVGRIDLDFAGPEHRSRQGVQPTIGGALLG